MEKNDFIKNKNVKDEKTFKKRKIVNGVTTAAMLIGCVAVGVGIPLLLSAMGGTLAAAVTSFGIVKYCLIGGAIGAAIGGVGSFIKHKCVDYSIIKDENKALKENKSLAESLEKESSKKELLEKEPNNKNQVEVYSPQEINKNAESEAELAR